MDHPAILGAQQQSSRFRSAAVSPTVASIGDQRRQASFAQRPVQSGGNYSAFASANVRPHPYAGPRLSIAPAQRMQRLLQAYLIHHGFQE